MGDNGTTLRENLNQVYKSTGKKPQKLLDAENIKVPPHLEYLWGYFLELCSSQEINWQELKTWADCTGRELVPWEFKILRHLADTRNAGI